MGTRGGRGEKERKGHDDWIKMGKKGARKVGKEVQELEFGVVEKVAGQGQQKRGRRS